MTALRELTEYIEGLTDLTIGTDLFCGFIPTDVQSDCVALLSRTPGAVSRYRQDNRELPVQVFAQATTYDAAESLASQAFEAAITGVVVQLGDDWELVSSDGHTPAYLGQDPSGRFTFSGNIVAKMRRR